MFESELLTQGFSTLLNNPQALLFATFGVMLGIVIGALPGLTATMGVAILLSTVVPSPQFCSKFPERLPPQPPLLMVMS